MAPFFRSRKEFGKVKVNGAGSTGGTGGSHSSCPICPSGHGVKLKVESQGREPCVPKPPQHHLPLDHPPGDSGGLGGSWLLSGMCDLTMGSWHDPSPHPGHVWG